jgi:ribosomal protein L37AE/L43A
MVSPARYGDVGSAMSPQTQVRPCPVCDILVPVKLTHRGKPYWQCDSCGVQVFVRRKEGIERFRDSDAKKHKEDNASEGLPWA